MDLQRSLKDEPGVGLGAYRAATVGPATKATSGAVEGREGGGDIKIRRDRDRWWREVSE